MKPQIVLRFLMEGAGGFINTDVFATEEEAKGIIKEWQMRTLSGIYRHPSGSWAVQMDSVRGIFSFAIPTGGVPAVNPPRSPFPAYSGN